MPKNDTDIVAAGAWTEITDADVTNITFFVDAPNGRNSVYIKATVGASAPTDLDGAIRYTDGQGERNVALTDLFPGISGANRVYAYPTDTIARVFVSHA